MGNNHLVNKQRKKKQVKLWRVGGCNRDEILGIPVKDVDFAVEAGSFDEMLNELVEQGFVIHTTKEEFLTVRAGVPKTHPLYSETHDADFVLCREDSETSDGRRPDFVEPGTILDDLQRRDFTCNAFAKNPDTGEWLDPHNGIKDIHNRTLRFVGEPDQRIREDGLRVLRAYRFMVTKRFRPSALTQFALESNLAAEMLEKVSVERVREELNKMFVCDTLTTIEILSGLSYRHKIAIFRDGLRLEATLKG